MPVSLNTHYSIMRGCSIADNKKQSTKTRRKYQATDAVAALSLRMAEASGFPRKGTL